MSSVIINPDEFADVEHYKAMRTLDEQDTRKCDYCNHGHNCHDGTGLCLYEGCDCE